MKTSKEIIELTLRNYSAAIDRQLAIEAEQFMETNFRVVLNNYKNLPEPTVLTKEQYLGMIRDGKAGGANRSISIEFIDTNSTVAIAKVKLESEKNIFKTYYHLVKKAGNWYILSDTPEIISK